MTPTTSCTFKESLVSELTAWSTVEHSDRFPDTFTFPAYGGSGVIFYGLDASGFQGTNCNLTAKYLARYGTSADDLNVYHKRIQSAHMLFDDMLGSSNQMPLGYMTFDLHIDGYQVWPGDFTLLASNWERVIDLRDGTTITSYEFTRGVRIKIEHVLLMGSVNPYFRITFASIDGNSHTVDWRFFLKPRTRHGHALWDEAPAYLCTDEYGAIVATARTLKAGRYFAVDDYELGWGISMTGAEYEIQQHLDRITLIAKRRFTVTPTADDSAELVLHFGSSETDTAVPQTLTAALQAAASISFDETVAMSRSYWSAFYARTAEYHTGDNMLEYMYHRSLQLLVSGIALDTGAPPCFQFVSGCTWWQNSTYYDSMHILRGLLQSNAVSEATALMRWYRDYAWQQEARPLYWMTRFDGFPITKQDNDLAFMTLTILGLTPAVFAECVDRGLLQEEGLYRMLRHVAEYAEGHLLTMREGVYYLDSPVIFDITPDALTRPLSQDGFVLLTLRPIFRKLHAYAILLDIDAEHRERWLDIAEHLYVPKDDEEYLLTADNGQRTGWPLSWLQVHSLSPSDPQLNTAQQELWKPRERKETGHPWGTIINAVSCLDWGDVDTADMQLEIALSSGVYGIGYFAEFSLDDAPYGRSAHSLANLPPFSSPHGAYLYAVAHFFVRSSIWENQVEIGPPVHSRLATNCWSCSRVRALNGAVVTAQGDAVSHKGTVTAPAYRMITVTVVRPVNLAAATVTLRTGATVQQLCSKDAITFTVAPDESVDYAVE